MAKLEELYEIIAKLKTLGLTLNEEQTATVDELEEQLIETEILPVISESVEPLLSPIKRELVLLVEYHPGRPVTVALSRKAKITDIAGTKRLTYTQPRESTPVVADEPVVKPEPHEPTKHVENSTKGMKVTFPDGTVICHTKAIFTFVQTLKRIGFSRVAALGITHGGSNLVSREKRETKPGTVWQHLCDGWYVYSNLSNNVKRSDLQKISDRLDLGLVIEEGKPE